MLSTPQSHDSAQTANVPNVGDLPYVPGLKLNCGMNYPTWWGFESGSTQAESGRLRTIVVAEPDREAKLNNEHWIWRVFPAIPMMVIVVPPPSFVRRGELALATLLWFEQDIFADNYFLLCLGECLANKRFWAAFQENTTNPFAMTLVVRSWLVVVVMDVFYLVVSLLAWVKWFGGHKFVRPWLPQSCRCPPEGGPQWAVPFLGSLPF